MFYFELKVNFLRMNKVILSLLSFICILIQHRSPKADNSMIRWNNDTKAPHEIIRYDWTIADFNSLREKYRICTEILTKNTQAHTSKWRVCLHPYGIEYYSMDYIGLRLELVNRGDEFEKAIVKFRASIIDNERRERLFSEEVKVLDADVNDICWEEFFREDRKLIQYELLKEGALTLCILISYYIECRRPTTSLEPNIVKCDLLDDLSSLLENPKHADVDLILPDNKIFHVHKAILAARSDHFARLFEHLDKKHEKIIVNITNTDEEILYEVLRYIYTGKCEISNQIAKWLFEAADQYKLEGLKTLCWQFMCDELSVENAAKMLVLADKYRSQEFKSKVVKFIFKHSVQVSNTTDWKNMVEPNYRLLREISGIFAYGLSLK